MAFKLTNCCPRRAVDTKKWFNRNPKFASVSFHLKMFKRGLIFSQGLLFVVLKISATWAEVKRVRRYLATSTSSGSSNFEIPNFCSAVAKASSRLWVWLDGCRDPKSTTSGRWLCRRALNARPSRHDDVKSWKKTDSWRT